MHWLDALAFFVGGLIYDRLKRFAQRAIDFTWFLMWNPRVRLFAHYGLYVVVLGFLVRLKDSGVIQSDEKAARLSRWMDRWKARLDSRFEKLYGHPLSSCKAALPIT
jgi:hypothetical protein